MSELALERTFAFVDLAGFTALTEVHGDDEAVIQVERFVTLVRSSLRPGDQLVKCIGDAVMLAFDRPESAVRTLRVLLESCAQTVGLPVPRTGLHHGPAVPRDGDWFGATVNLAARVAAQAHGGQTLATATSAEAARETGVPVHDLGMFTLKNLQQPVELFELELIEPDSATSIDPVCRMRIPHDTAAGRLRHRGEDYWFCSFRCVQAFVVNPEQHLDA